MRHAISAAVVALFAIVFLHAAWAIRLLNPVFSRYLGVGLPGGPNVLLTVRGRSSGQSRSAPVSMMQLGDRRFVQAAFGEVSWVRNLRASGQAVVTNGRNADAVDTVELTPEAAAAIMREALAPYERSRLLRAVVGPTTRPPHWGPALFQGPGRRDPRRVRRRRSTLSGLRAVPAPVAGQFS